MALEQVYKEPTHTYWKDVTIDASGANSSAEIPVATAAQASYQVVWSGMTGTATAELQTSIDGTNWDTVTGTSEVTSGASGSYTKALSDMPGIKARLTITSAATAGNLALHLVSKKS